MSHVSVTLTDALVKDLNVAFDGVLVVDRRYRVKHLLTELSDLKVSAVASGKVDEMFDRGSVKQVITVTLIFQKQVDPEDLPAQDELMETIQSVEDWMRTHSLSTLPDAKWFRSASGDQAAPLGVVEHLDQYRVFTGVIQVAYMIRR